MLAYLIIWLLLTAAAALVLKRLAVDAKVTVITLTAIAFCFLHMTQTTVADFGVDTPWHTEYVEYVAKNGELPTDYNKHKAGYHQPSFYVVSSVFYSLGNAVGLAEPLELARFTPLICFATYLIIIALMFRRVLTSWGAPQYLMFAMLAFWPISIAISGRLHVDAFSYLGQIGVIYSLICWQMDKSKTALANAFAFCGVLMLAKNFGVFLLIVTFGFLLWAIYNQRQQCRQLLSRRMVLSIAFAGFCYVLPILLDRPPVPNMQMSHLHDQFTWWDWVVTYTYFNPLLFVTTTAQAPYDSTSIDYFWHYFLRTALLGDFTNYKAWPVVFAIMCVWLGIMLYIIVGLFACRKNFTQADKKAGSIIIFFMGLLIAMSMTVRYIHVHMQNIADARYVLPVTALAILLFARINEIYIQRDKLVAARIGSGLAIGLVALSILLWVGQYLLS